MKKNIIILVGIFLVLLIAVLLSNQQPRKVKKVVGTESTVQIDSTQINHIEIKRPNDQVVLKFQNNEWRVVEPVEARANQKSVETLVSATINHVQFGDLISDNPDKKDVFGITDDEAVAVTFKDGDTELLSFLVGKYVQGMTFIRRPGADQVYQIQDPYRNKVSKRPLDWRDKTVLDLERQAIDKVLVMLPEASYELVNADTMWFYSEGGSLLPTKPNIVSGFEGVLKRLQAVDFVDEPDSTTLALFNPPQVVFEIIQKTGTITNLELTYKNEADTRYFARKDGELPIYMVNRTFVENVLKTKEDLVSMEE